MLRALRSQNLLLLQTITSFARYLEVLLEVANLKPKLLDIEIPEGVDPAFLAALPDDIREEVIRDHLRQQRIQQANQQRRTQEEVVANTNNTATEAEPLDQEFMAALPPELQEEVLAQHEQRLAQQRQEQAVPAQGNDAADIVSLFESLPPGLRAQVLGRSFLYCYKTVHF